MSIDRSSIESRIADIATEHGLTLHSEVLDHLTYTVSDALDDEAEKQHERTHNTRDEYRVAHVTLGYFVPVAPGESVADATRSHLSSNDVAISNTEWDD